MDTENVYKIIPPPSHISGLSAGHLRLLADTVAYEQHPAYQHLISNRRYRTRILSFWIFSKSFFLILLKRLIRYEMIPLDIRKPSSKGGYAQLVLAALGNMFGFQKNQAIPLEKGIAADIYETFSKNGCAVIQLPEEAYMQLAQASAGHFSMLKEHRRRSSTDKSRDFEESRMYVRRASDSDLFGLIESVLRQSGALDAASHHLKREARLVDVNPQINDASDDFWRRIFPDLQMKHPATAYFHRDASGGDIKFIFYLSDVGETGGPFSYVLGSHNASLPRVDDYICEANDSNGLSGTSRKSRERFSALPKFLRKKGALGNDLPEGELAQSILQSQWSICAPKGAVVMFATKGIHRGGMVMDGERLVITCVVG